MHLRYKIIILSAFCLPGQWQYAKAQGTPPAPLHIPTRLFLPKPNYESTGTFSYYSIDKEIRGKHYKTWPLSGKSWTTLDQLDALNDKMLKSTQKTGDSLYAIQTSDDFTVQNLFEFATVFEKNRLTQWMYDPRTAILYVVLISEPMPPPTQVELLDNKIGAPSQH